MKARNIAILMSLTTLLATSVMAQSRRDNDYSRDGDRYDRAQIRHNFRDSSMGDRYRRDTRVDDVCMEIKEKLTIAENRYENAENNLRTASSVFSQARNTYENRSQSLSTKQNLVRNLEVRIASLKADYDNAISTNLEQRYATELNLINDIVRGKQSAVKEQEVIRKRAC